VSERRRRSAAAAQASRTNGARSKGPKSAAGKDASSRNAQKHGLFRTDLDIEASPSPRILTFAEDLRLLAWDGWEAAEQRNVALDAVIRLDQATKLVRGASEGVSRTLSSDALDVALLVQQLRDLIRYRRYEGRLRGRRDRAVRKLLARQNEIQGG